MKKIAIVTGATSGYGLATAKKLQADGFTVLIVSRNAEKIARNVKKLGLSHKYGTPKQLETQEKKPE